MLIELHRIYIYIYIIYILYIDVYRCRYIHIYVRFVAVLRWRSNLQYHVSFATGEPHDLCAVHSPGPVLGNHLTKEMDLLLVASCY